MDSADSPGTVAVIGAGAWGTTLAWLLGGKGHETRLWARRSQQAAAISRERENRLRLPGVRLPETVAVTARLDDALDGAQVALVAVPSAHLRETAHRMAPHIPPQAVIISATKGLEVAGGKRMSEVLAEETGAEAARILALSGPNLSGEIAQGMPAVSVMAGTDAQRVEWARDFFSTRLFRIYANYDILGVEVCGALKNVIALGAGISDGLGFGANAKAALVCRGLAEIGRLGTALGAARATFWGAAGVGDILATCNSRLSRNRQVGHRLGRGESVEAALSAEGGVAEGVPTTAAAHDLAARMGVETPIISALHGVLFENKTPGEAVRELMARRWRAEAEAWQ